MKIITNQRLLRQVSEPIKEITSELRQLVRDMKDTMYENKGFGLSAIQVGIPIRLLVFDCAAKTLNANNSQVMFNPEIIWHSEEVTTTEEGCLSLPNQYFNITRYYKIKVKYIDIHGRDVINSFQGLAARIIQHELNHMDSILICDIGAKND
jgi:peptide deformylase